jgi:RNA polymerase-binding transcription factor DksA
MIMKTGQSEVSGFQEILARKEAGLVHVLRRRDGIAIEKSADQMDEIQYATERDLAIRNVDRESSLLREVKNALRRVQEGSWKMHGLRLGDQPQTARSAAMGSFLYPVPGRC